MPSTDSIIGVQGIEKTSPQFRRRLIEVADELGINPDYLATVISFESGFSPTVRNPYSGCVGLIQWCRQAAVAEAASAGMSLSSDAALNWLATLSDVQQLDHVKAYFSRILKGRRGLSLLDTYLVVFSPAFIGRPADYVAYRQGEQAYEQNKGFDSARDGTITVGEIGSKVTGVYNQGLQRARVSVSGGLTAFTASAAGAAGARAAVVLIGAALGWVVVADYVIPYVKGIAKP